jgi:hypothetical protein
LDKAHAQLDCVAVIERDARILNNLGVLKMEQRKIDEAAQCFESALAIEADHALATFNASTLKSPSARGKLDRTGAAGAMDDTRSKALLENVVRFAPEQILEVHVNGKWTIYHVGSQAFQDQFSVNPLPLFHYRPVEWSQRGKKKGIFEVSDKVWYPSHEQQQLFALDHASGKWVLRTATKDVEKKTDWNANNTPAFFTDEQGMFSAMHAYTFELRDKHSCITDLFSGQTLSTRTQTARVHYCNQQQQAKILATDKDVDRDGYQRELAERVQSGKPAKHMLTEMFAVDDKAASTRTRYLLLILGGWSMVLCSHRHSS